MPDITATLGSLTLKNPVIPASGTFGYGAEFAELYDLNILGAIAFKGTTRESRYGNETPRIAECESGLLNAIGLQNPGIERVIREELPALRERFSGPIVANISGFSVDEYVECCARIDGEAQVEIIEVNISCPNVRHGGLAFGSEPGCAAEVVREVKAVCRKPVYMKLSPNVTDVVAVAGACAEAGADGLSLINTLMGMRIDVRTRRPILANRTGGLSGPAIFPVALRMVNDVSHAVSVPVIGIGGISSARDVIEMMMAGASAVQVGSANLVDPYACKKIIEDLPRETEKLGVGKLDEIVGVAR